MNTSEPIPPFDFDVSSFGPLPTLRGLFVTGTDTEVGKTLIAGAIARSLARRGHNVEVFKPVATGCRRRREGLVSEDAVFLAACVDSRRMLSDIAPVRYSSALAPNVAAEREGRAVDLALIFDAYRRLAADDPGVVVEGIGGLLCPITDEFWVAHLARLLALPVVIVARSGLGTINHTLLTLHAARSAGLNVAGVVMNRYLIEPPKAGAKQGDSLHTRGDSDLAMHTNPAQIEQRGQTKVLALVHEDAENSVAKACIAPGTQAAIDSVDWHRVCGLR
ncbi:MAG TPA: dethiobiotin synthase [Phycisphaerae bacterium]|nr:dethiobiotin synthase [Phycisphaerae bacterium]HUT56788.1 dethiobiotin synthase [Phycisphaerae bacterium]